MSVSDLFLPRVKNFSRDLRLECAQNTRRNESDTGNLYMKVKVS